MDKTLNIVKYALEMENRVKEFYQEYQDKVSNRKIRRVFAGLAAMEEEHIDYLKKLSDSLAEDKPMQIEEDESVSVADNIINESEVKLGGVDFEHDLQDLPILRMAYLMEKDFVAFYEKAARTVEDPVAKKMLQKLASWEKLHEEDLKEEHKDLLDKRWMELGFFPW